MGLMTSFVFKQSRRIKFRLLFFFFFFVEMNEGEESKGRDELESREIVKLNEAENRIEKEREKNKIPIRIQKNK